MAKTKVINLLPPYQFQREIEFDNHRFRVVACGRRWGKTLLAMRESFRTIVERYMATKKSQRGWVVAPTFPLVREDWLTAEVLLKDAITNKRETLMRMDFKPFGFLEFKSADRGPDGLIGAGLDCCVVDEASRVSRESWEQGLRPALSDKLGKCIFISTPKGRNWFYELWLKGQVDNDEIKSWKHDTFSNPFFPVEEAEAIKNTTPELIYRQEYLADFLEDTASVFKNIETCLRGELEGNINSVEDETIHQWEVYCLDKNTGEILWEKTAHEGVPRVKRHPMSTHANSTPATDGQYVIAFFGSEGLYCYDMHGELVWKKDFGVLNSAFFSVPTAEWGFASSPVIHDGVVVVQCDALNTAFLAALDIRTGTELWRTSRDDYPTWSTPTIHVGDLKTQVIVNGFKHLGGYDFHTGEEIWKIVGGGDIPIPTPVVAENMVYINSAHGRMSPIYAVRLDAQGDISLIDDETSNEKIVWSVSRGGAYIPTPLIYRDYLYNLNWNGSLNCFHAKTGEEIYREQLGRMTAFAASGVAADGKLYFADQEGNVYVVRAGPDFEILATNVMNDEILATPAISDGRLYFRTHHYLIAVAEK